MILVEPLWSGPLQVWLGALQLLVVLGAARMAPWRSLLGVPVHQHLLFGALLSLILLWQINGHIVPEVRLHLLGMTTVTLLLGAPLAVLVGSVAATVVGLLAGAPWQLIGMNALFNATVPVMVTALVLRLVLRYGPRNLFAYMLGVGFAGGALAMFAVLLMMIGLFADNGQARAVQAWASPVMLLAMFPEAFLNGALVSSLAVYKPHWLRSFDEQYYIDGA